MWRRPVASHPFRDCGVAEIRSAQTDQEARAALSAVLIALDALTASSAALLQSLGIPTSLPLAELEPLAGISANIADGSVPSGWRDEAAWRALRERVTAWSDLRDDQAARRTDLARRWDDSILALDDMGTLAALFARWATAFFLLAWIFLFGARKRLRALAQAGLPANEQIAADLAKAKLVRENEELLLRSDERAITRLFEPCTSTTAPADIVAGAGAWGQAPQPGIDTSRRWLARLAAAPLILRRPRSISPIRSVRRRRRTTCDGRQYRSRGPRAPFESTSPSTCAPSDFRAGAT